METICRPSSVDWGRAKAAILLFLVLQALMLSCPTPGETAGWTATGPLIAGRIDHTATLLGNGKVLVAGGTNIVNSSSIFFTRAELYDPGAKTWSGTNGPLATGRVWHTASLLGNGQVLVAGGYNNGVRLASAELYNPVAKTWSGTGALATVRFGHTATRLGTGQVLVAGGGGAGGATLNTAELYDPVKKTWKATGALITGRGSHTATRLGNGQVLVAGGYGDDYLTGCSILR